MTTRPLLVLLFALFAACNTTGAAPSGSPAGAASQPSSGKSCDDREDAAKKALTAAAESGLSCKSDADCAVVELSASCADACSRSVNAQGAAALKAAAGKLEAEVCAQFAKDGCTAHHPPCAPPRPARCASGSCG